MSPDQPLSVLPQLDRIVRAEFPDNPCAARLIDEFLRHRPTYRREFVEALIAVATSPTGADPSAGPDRAWEVRCLAALMLQFQFLRLPAKEEGESLVFLDLLGLLDPDRPAPRLTEEVLKEGYTTVEPTAFLREFRRHLGRLSPLLSPLRRRRVSPRAIRDFIATTRQECKLALARYLFHPDEVAERIFDRVRRSEGEPTRFKFPHTAGEASRKIAGIPGFEASLVEALRSAGETFWAGDETSAQLNALVEQPIGTVVLTIKPPGSRLEIEIKRAGRRAGRPLAIVHDRNGRPVPPSHRLDGGSAADMLQWEAGHAACLAKTYRLVHGKDAPISVVTGLIYANKLPVGDGRSAHLIDYFTDPSLFGDDFPEMRRALGQAVASFAKERGAGVSGLQGEWGQTLEFLQYAVPAQSILVGSSSFRLDLLARYLSADGARLHFEDGLKTRAKPGAARRFADTLLEEVLGLYRPPDTRYESHESYLDAAFALPRNRARADRVHASVSRQLGTFWATFLALRAYSYGESFVARNVGLRCLWEQGRWKVRLIFMDHDNLHLPNYEGEVFNPSKILPAMIHDENHVMGHLPKLQTLSGAIDYLRAIYRIDDPTAARHLFLLRESMVRAYRKTQRRLATSPGLRRMIPAGFIAASQAWDEAAAIFLRNRGSDPGWSAEAEASLKSRGLSSRLRKQYLGALETFAPFLERLAFLYTGDPLHRG